MLICKATLPFSFLIPNCWAHPGEPQTPPGRCARVSSAGFAALPPAGTALPSCVCVCVRSATGLPASKARVGPTLRHSEQFLPRVEGPPPRPKAWHEIRSGKQPQSWELAPGVLPCVRSHMRAGTREGPCNSSAQLQQHRGAKPAWTELSHPKHTPRGCSGTTRHPTCWQQ